MTQYRKVPKNNPKKGKKTSGAKKLDALVKKERPAIDADILIRGFSGSVILGVLDLCRRLPPGASMAVDQINRKLLFDPDYLPDADECSYIVRSAILYQGLIPEEGGMTLRERLIAQERDDMPDSLADPRTL